MFCQSYVEAEESLPLSKEVGSPKEGIYLWQQEGTIFECQASPIKTICFKREVGAVFKEREEIAATSSHHP